MVARRCTNPTVAAAAAGSGSAGGAAAGTDSDGDDLLGDLEEAEADEGGVVSAEDLKKARCDPAHADAVWSELGGVDFRFFASRE